MYWHWIDYLKRAATLNGRQPCFLDETLIPQATMKATGHIEVPSQKQIRPRRRLEASLRKGMARMLPSCRSSATTVSHWWAEGLMLV